MKVDDNETTVAQCICPECPTYDDCMREASETLYCARGETRCEARAVECICPDCAVWSNYSLSSTFFCLEGAAE